jgi:hypothetical protein
MAKERKRKVTITTRPDTVTDVLYALIPILQEISGEQATREWSGIEWGRKTYNRLEALRRRIIRLEKKP